MKKNSITFCKTVLATALLAFAFSACEGPMGPQGPPGESAGGVNWNVTNYTVRTGDWAWDNDLSCFFYAFNSDVPITDFIVTDGIIVCSVYDEYSKTYKPLPFIAEKYDTGEQMYYHEVIDFEYETGYIAFNVKASDLFDNVLPTWKPSTYTFKVTMIW
jgi:hypothetical protein